MSAPEPEASLMRSYVLILREEWKNCQQWTAFKKRGAKKEKKKESPYPNLYAYMDLVARNAVKTEI